MSAHWPKTIFLFFLYFFFMFVCPFFWVCACKSYYEIWSRWFWWVCCSNNWFNAHYNLPMWSLLLTHRTVSVESFRQSWSRSECFEVQKKRKEKITPLWVYWRECEPVGLTLIMVFRDTMCGFMPPFPSPIGYMLTSFSFLFYNLKLDWFICN